MPVLLDRVHLQVAEPHRSQIGHAGLAALKVPRQIAVTGFDGIGAAEQFIPPITTIEQPLQEIVQRAFKAIFEPSQNTEALLPGRFIARQTT